MANIDVSVVGMGEIQATLSELGPSVQKYVYGPSLGAMASIVRIRARTRDYGFMDRTGVRAFDRAKGRETSVRLRGTIRSRRIAARYGGRRYKAGRAAVFAGGRGAHHAFLVEVGHGGPRPAAARSYLTRALIETQGAQFSAFVSKAQDRFPVAVATATRRGNALGASFGRTIARRRR